MFDPISPTVRLIEELAVRRPDIPALVVESVGRAGQLAAAALSGGFDLPLTPDFTFETRQPVPPEAVVPWLSVIEHLYDNEPAYTAAAAKARSAAEAFRWDHLRPRYAAFFQSLLP